MDNIKAFGCMPSPEDNRDYTEDMVISCVNKEFPEEYKSKNIPILNQGVVGSCTAHAIAAAMMRYQENEYNKHEDLSRGYIYGNRADTDHQGVGQNIRQALKQVNKCGDCLYKDFHYNKEYPTIKEYFTDDLPEKAANHKIATYYRCYTTDEIKRAIISNGGVIACMPCYENFDTKIDKFGYEFDGYHAILIVGWTKDNYWVVQNSWGKYWGDKGYFYLNFNYKCNEYWSINLPNNKIKPESIFSKIFRLIKDWFKSLLN